MLANAQIRSVTREIDRTAHDRMHDCDDEFDRQQLWEVVRRACHAIEAVAELESQEVGPTDRLRRTRYLIHELETALEAAKRAKVVLDWTAVRNADA
jgi:hypothetical protein